MLDGILSAINSYAAVLPGGHVTTFLIAFGIFAFVFYTVAMILFQAIKVLTSKTKTTLDDILIDRARRPMKIFSILLSAYISLLWFYPEFVLGGYGTTEVFIILAIIAGTYSVDRIADGLMVWYGQEIAPKTDSKFDDEIYPLFRKIVRVLIYIFGLIILLNKLGIEISAFIAGLGIAGLAVALALQDTLANFFAGVYILADKPIKPGDYIKMEDGSGVEGTVEEVGWRSTRIRTTAQNLVFVPNSKMATAIITNFYSPAQEMTHTLVIGASYNDEPEKVLASLKAAVASVAKRTGKIVKPENATIRADKFGESSVEYKVIVYIPTYLDKFPVQGELVKEIYYQFRKDGISIPFPTRTVYFEGGSAPKEFKVKKGKKA